MYSHFSRFSRSSGNPAINSQNLMNQAHPRGLLNFSHSIRMIVFTITRYKTAEIHRIRHSPGCLLTFAVLHEISECIFTRNPIEKVFSPVCVNMCCRTDTFCINVLPHNSHEKGFFSLVCQDVLS